MRGFALITTLLILSISYPSYSYAQQILVVNNRTASSTATNFNKLQDAIDAATDGDIIHLIPSASSYGNVVVNKAISIYGIGVNDQIHEVRSQLGNIELNVTNEEVLQNVLISGLVFENLQITSATKNVQVKQNQFNRLFQTAGSQEEVYIIQNVFTSFSFASTDLQNVVISNNVFNVPFSGSNTFSSNSEGPLLIYYNLFLTNAIGSSSFSPAFRNLTASIVQGNIFYNVSPNPSTVVNTLFTNNLSYLSNNPFFPESTNGNESLNNLTNQNPSFTNIPIRTFWDFSMKLEFEPNSPAIGAGLDGNNLGPASGYYPWNPSSSPLPYIDNLDLELQEDGKLRVRLNAKSGN